MLTWPWTERLAIVVTVSGIVAFAALTGLIATPPIQSFDERIVLSLRNSSDRSLPVGPAWFVELARDVTALGGYGVLTTLTVLVTVFLRLEQKRMRARFVVITVLSGYLLSMSLKSLISRPRPDFVEYISQHVHSFSFPSGHSMMSAIVYLTLGLMLSDLARRRRVKVFLVAAALTISAVVGFSRIYMGVHYPTDVIAGWWIGLSWALTCWLIVRRRRALADIRECGFATEESVTAGQAVTA